MGRPPRITREQILQAAQTVFSERGFAATTLAEIAGPLGVTAAAILRHFPSKQALFTAAMSGRVTGPPPYIEELATADASDDPAGVLRHFAEQFVPFVSTLIRSAVAVQMHMATRQTTVVVPFDTEAEESPSRRGLRIISDYFRRAMEAGTIRKGDPRAMALLFISHLHSYVFIHQVLNVSPVYPLDDYLDALFRLWKEGAIVSGGAHAIDDPTTRGEDAAAGGDSRSRRRGTGVRAGAAQAKATDARRNTGSKNDQRGIADRRPGGKGPRR